MSSEPGIVTLQRVLRAPPSRVYRAFLDPQAIAKWMPPYGFIARVDVMDVRVGGSFHMAFSNFSTGSSQSFGGTFLELVPDTLIRYTDSFDNPDLPGEMRVSVRLRAVACGTELLVEQAGVPAMIPLEFCYLGWQESLAQLAHLVEPEIPDGA